MVLLPQLHAFFDDFLGELRTSLLVDYQHFNLYILWLNYQPYFFGTFGFICLFLFLFSFSIFSSMVQGIETKSSTNPWATTQQGGQQSNYGGYNFNSGSAWSGQGGYSYGQGNYGGNWNQQYYQQQNQTQPAAQQQQQQQYWNPVS